MPDKVRAVAMRAILRMVSTVVDVLLECRPLSGVRAACEKAMQDGFQLGVGLET
jgi:hypothetical protein